MPLLLSLLEDSESKSVTSRHGPLPDLLAWGLSCWSSSLSQLRCRFLLSVSIASFLLSRVEQKASIQHRPKSSGLPSKCHISFGIHRPFDMEGSTWRVVHVQRARGELSAGRVNMEYAYQVQHYYLHCTHWHCTSASKLHIHNGFLFIFLANLSWQIHHDSKRNKQTPLSDIV